MQDDDVWRRNKDTVDELFLGIDFGTCNSCMAIWHPGKSTAKVIKSSNGTRTTPTTLRFGDNFSDEQFGMDMSEFPNVIGRFKPLMGVQHGDEIPAHSLLSGQLHQSSRALSTEDDHEPIQITCRDSNNHVFSTSAESLATRFLRYMKDSAEEYLSRKPVDRQKRSKVLGCVVGVPAYYSYAQRQATIQAAAAAGFKHVHLLIESTAAAVAYGLFVTGEKQVCVFDMGGGTTDVTIMHINEGKFSVRGSSGVPIGGTHMDETLMRLVASKLGVDHTALEDKEVAKEALSTTEIVEVVMSGHAAVTVSRVEYEKSIQHLVESAKTCASSILQDLSLMPTDIHEVVLVGGATRTPAVRAMLLSLFETSPSGAIRELCVSVDADEAVAQGLAIQGAILSGVDHSILQDMLMMDALPRSVGLLTATGSYDIVIPRNSAIPCEVRKVFKMDDSVQAFVSLDIYEEQVTPGQNDNADPSISLMYTTDMRVPLRVRDRAASEVTVVFTLDSNGVLFVRLGDPATEGEPEAEGKVHQQQILLLLVYVGLLMAVYVFVRFYFSEELATTLAQPEHPTHVAELASNDEDEFSEL